MEEVKNETAAVEVTEENQAPETTGRKSRRTFTGRVVSDKMDKTIVVAIETKVRHPLYGKIMNRTTKHKPQNEHNEAQSNDRVKMIDTRPSSKDKNFRLVRIIEKAK